MSRILHFKAKDNADLGHQMGEHFRERIQHRIEKEKHPKWDREVKQALRHWPITRRLFPHYAEEVMAYARAAKVKWQDLWTTGLESGSDLDRCTAMVTNRGTLVGHNEDYEPGAEHDLFLVRRTVGTLTVLDFDYYYTLGGNSVSVNAHGWAQLINTVHSHTRLYGIPRNVICRWLSETKDPEKDARRLKKMDLMNGYSHTFVSAHDGRTLNLEVAAHGVTMKACHLPYVHTNHYLSGLETQETFVSGSSSNRYEVARRKLKPRMTVDALKKVMSDRTRGKDKSIFNEDTIGRMVIDFKRQEAHAWFKATPRKGYAVVPLDFLR